MLLDDRPAAQAPRGVGSAFVMAAVGETDDELGAVARTGRGRHPSSSWNGRPLDCKQYSGIFISSNCRLPASLATTNASTTSCRQSCEIRSMEAVGGEVCKAKKEEEPFVLVHGACHGAWCWFKLASLLSGRRHRVSCIDLAGAAGSLVDPNHVRSFHDYDAPLLDFMAALPDGHKVILVGHSAGGLSVTHAMRLFTHKIKRASFIAATMLPFGYQIEQDFKDGVPDLSEFRDVYDLNFGLGEDRPPTSIALRKEYQRTILYQQSSQEDSTLASILLRPFPAVLSTARFGCVDDGVESPVNAVHRAYIKTANDRVVKPEQQEAMIRCWPPRKVMVMDTDHSPFFSAPDRLLELIIESL